MVVETLDQLKVLYRKKKPRREIQLQIGSHKDTLYIPFQEKLNSYINECGCSWGSYFLTSAIVVALIFVISVSTIGFWSKMLIALVWCVVVAALGKMIGLRVAKMRYYNTLQELIQKLEGSR